MKKLLPHFWKSWRGLLRRKVCMCRRNIVYLGFCISNFRGVCVCVHMCAHACMCSYRHPVQIVNLSLQVSDWTSNRKKTYWHKILSCWAIVVENVLFSPLLIYWCSSRGRIRFSLFSERINWNIWVHFFL